jgi:predicted RNase H-like nuclease (RuvC/YqgF family)
MTGMMESLVKKMVETYRELESTMEKMSNRIQQDDRNGVSTREDDEYLSQLEKEVKELDAALDAVCPQWFELYLS